MYERHKIIETMIGLLDMYSIVLIFEPMNEDQQEQEVKVVNLLRGKLEDWAESIQQ